MPKKPVERCPTCGSPVVAGMRFLGSGEVQLAWMCAEGRCEIGSSTEVVIEWPFEEDVTVTWRDIKACGFVRVD